MCLGPCQKCMTCKKPMRKNQSSQKGFACGQMFHLKCLVDQIEYGCERVYCRSCMVDKQNVENAWKIFKGLLKSVIDKDVPLTKKKYKDVTVRG